MCVKNIVSANLKKRLMQPAIMEKINNNFRGGQEVQGLTIIAE